MSDLLAPVVVCVNNDIPRPAVFNVVYFIYLRTIRCSCYQMDNLLLKSERLFTRRVCAVFRLLPDEATGFAVVVARTGRWFIVIVCGSLAVKHEAIRSFRPNGMIEPNRSSSM